MNIHATETIWGHVIAFKSADLSVHFKPKPDMKACTRRAVVAIVICSWITIANHCAFAAVVAKTDSVQTDCPFHSKQAKEKQEPGQVQCCKVLRAVVLPTTKSWARDKARFSKVDLRVEEFLPIALLDFVQASLSLDTGPPVARSFAELILQRSLLAHAPPVRA